MIHKYCILMNLLIQAAIRDPNPVVFLENEIMYSQAFDVSDHVLDKDFLLPIGKAKIMREGNSIHLITGYIKIYLKYKQFL